MTELTLALFANHVGEAFIIHEAPEGMEWTLIEAKPFDQIENPATCRSFSLVFRGARAPLFAQQVIGLDHPDIGPHAIFVVPIGHDEHGAIYEAVFN